MSVIVAFRTHTWNDDIKKIALRIKNTFTKAVFVIIADETNGPLDTGKISKVRHTADFTHLGLPASKTEKGLWFNGDYPLYALRQSFPEATHIIMIENDVQINFDLDIVIDYITKNNVDLVAHEIVDADKTWGFYNSLEYFEQRKKCLIPFIAISSRAIDHLLQTRIKMYEANKVWAYCEGFIPSAIYQMQNPEIYELNFFCRPHNYNFSNCYHYDDPRVNVPNTISHPIRGNNFPERCLSEQPISSVFFKNSILRVGLKNLDPKYFYDLVYSKILKTGNINTVKQFNDLALQEGWIMRPEAINWALGADAEQSSISAQFSRHKNISQDAKGAVSGNINADYSFHTEYEEKPWWKVKLHQTIYIRHIIIYNRLQLAERASRIKVEISENNDDWLTVAEYPDGILFGGADKNPLVIKVNAVLAQYVRISLLDRNILHLNQVEVYDQ
ncbi:Capsular polysaccharide biosynthesis protein [Commensalibacter communis]|uniref:discoidin domain-containing protein n=1 Tax=Commensalibacter communis TaxID=2972786 RepID=UPI0022FF7841|nr:discoidin domain-containing protein [Commensalibacter communis]CAI3945454.1 Capsular polysaccharide biosynthesis protein [Commensalibacter communis]